MLIEAFLAVAICFFEIFEKEIYYEHYQEAGQHQVQDVHGIESTFFTLMKGFRQKYQEQYPYEDTRAECDHQMDLLVGGPNRHRKICSDERHREYQTDTDQEQDRYVHACVMSRELLKDYHKVINSVKNILRLLIRWKNGNNKRLTEQGEHRGPG
jgi:hypothetical protein